ncbi:MULTISPECIES: tail fiber assembly protein [Pseudomonas]|uniref:tail fiber assembly protein n=1 Tax=Pseudomonas TaxID=286 RepID=UPI002B0547B7|nr:MULTISPECIES: tail fiber assembly protein [Pseudomonas]
MIIKLSPVRSDNELTVYKHGDSITVNGMTLDLSQLPDGASLPAAATGCAWILDPVERASGQLIISLSLPHGADAPEAARFPADIIQPVNGKVALPTPEAMATPPSQGYASIDWSQLVTAEAKAQAAADQLRAAVTVEIARRRSLADNAIAPLQDAVDIYEATPDEEALLKLWKKYRVSLSRLPEQEGYPNEIDWPEPPV